MILIKENKGLTLVEALVASIIAAILVSIIFTMFFMYNTQTKETIAYSRMQLQYENVAEQIATDTRRASRVVQNTTDFSNPFSPLEPETTALIIMVDTLGGPISRYRILSDSIQEWKNGAWSTFNAGGSKVSVESSSSVFYLNNNRDELSINLRLKTTVKDSTYFLNARKDVYVCRNQKLP